MVHALCASAIGGNHNGFYLQGIDRRSGSRYFAQKVKSVPLGILFGLAVGFVLAFLVAYLQHDHYLEIILPGSLVGLIVGYATQRYGAAPATTIATR